MAFFDEAAEAAVLGCIFLDPECFEDVMEKVKKEDFYFEAHRILYGAMESNYKQGKKIDVVTVSAQLGEKLELIGGYGALAQLAAGVPTTENLKAYLEIVQNLGDKRRLYGALKAQLERLENGESDDVRSKLLELGGDEKSEKEPESISRVMAQTFSKMEEAGGKAPGLSTGFGLDPMEDGELIIVAARPSVGKTAFALNIASHVAGMEKKHVLIFSLEMSGMQLSQRILSSVGNLQLKALRSGRLDEEGWRKAAVAVGKISAMKLKIWDDAAVSIEQIVRQCRMAKRRGELDLVILDYLQLIQTEGKNREQEVAALCRSLKQMALGLSVPVILLSQLNRASETRREHRPILSDLRESGSIEQDADKVIFLHREAYYDENADPTEAECIIAKNRNGVCRTEKLHWNGAYQEFSILH